MFRSIRAHIAIPYIILILAATAALTIYATNITQDSYLADLEGQLSAEARLVSESVSMLLAEGASADGIDALAKRLGQLLQARVTVIDPDGAVVGDSEEDPAVMENHRARPEVQAALAGNQGKSTHYSRTLGYRMMYITVPVRASGGQVIGVARVALPLTQIEERVTHLRYTIAVASLLTALLAGLLAVLIAGQITKPVRKLTDLAEQMAHGDLAGRIHVTSRDEVGRLGGAFNRMASELQTQIEAMEAQRSMLTAVLAHMADGVLITDAGGHVRLINPAAARLLGVDQEAAVGERFVALVRDHQIAGIWRRCRECNEELSEAVEMGRQRPFLRVIATRLSDTAEGECLVLLQDLTEMRRLEMVRRDLVSNISHELRTPLAGLKAVVDTLRDGALEDPPAARRFLDRIETEVDALTQMVQELLELSRIESGQVPLRLVPTALADLVIPPVSRLQPQAERGGLSMTVDLASPGEEPGLPYVLADAERVREVVTNLVHNAIKFTPAGGQVTISAHVAGEEVIISVQDTGTGIPADDLPRIFERFYKADRARSGGGTGLGLSIARHIVQGHGGRIWAESVEGRGSIFYFSLPAVKE
jgi:two-component system phosphate regulon sensor histidine kinase PhoR